MNRSTTMQQSAAILFTAALVGLALWPSSPNLLGWFGGTIAHGLVRACGVGAWWWPPLLVDAAWGLMINRPRKLLRTGKGVGLLILTVVLSHWLAGTGGRLGAAIGSAAVDAIGIGAYLCGAALLIWLALRALGDARVSVVLQSSRLRIAAAWHAGGLREQLHHTQLAQLHQLPRQHRELEAIVLDDAEVEHVDTATPAPRDQPPSPPPLRRAPHPVHDDAVRHTASRSAPAEKLPAARVVDLAPTPQPFRLPPCSLLQLAAAGKGPDLRRLQKTRLQLEDQLAGFGVRGTIDGMTTGPVLATFEYQPSPGTKISQIKALGGEMGLAVERGVRVIAPLPNTGRVGIEVPYAPEERATISLRELLEHPSWDVFRASAALPLALGMNSRGEPVYCDLAETPHLLVAGTTGSGKSVSLLVMLMSLLMSCTPRTLRLLLIDPKVVELGVFGDLPHLAAPVIHEMTDAAAALGWAVAEMERRYQRLAEYDVRDIDGYNSLPDVDLLPRVVLVLDEFGDLMAVHRKQVEPNLIRLAQKARAAGIHLILATQRPSADVVTGVIKANLPSRVALRVTQALNSKIILDRSGAEQLLGRGDALCMLPGELELQRVHGALVTQAEVRAVCAFLRGQAEPQYDDSVFTTPAQDAPSEDREVLYQRALALVAQARGCSTSQLQRRLSVGYNTAASLVERMEAEGIVGPAKKGGALRDVLRSPSGGQQLSAP